VLSPVVSHIFTRARPVPANSAAGGRPMPVHAVMPPRSMSSGTIRGLAAGLFGILILWECEDEQRAASGGTVQFRRESFHPAAPARGHGDVLFAVDAISHRIAVNSTPGLE
jgi:hypothetical protein